MTDISYQLYCSRNFPPTRDTCEMLGAAGYTQVEGYGGLFDDIATLKEDLNRAGLQMTSAHMGLDLVEGDPAKAIDIAKTLLIKKIYVPYLMPEDRPTDTAGWKAFAQRLKTAGEPIVDAGIGFGWHNHDFEFEPTEDGSLPQDLIAEAGINLELDLGWVARAGLDPVKTIQRYGNLITSVHVKDIAPEGTRTDEDGWADVGHGIMDWPAIHAALQGVGVHHYVIEHDNPSDHARFAQRSLATVKAL